MTFPVPTNKKELERFLGFFVNYSKWIKDFSKITYPLFEAKRLCSFLLSAECVETIKIIKKEIANATLAVPIHNVPLDLETDASTDAFGAVSSQNGQPIAFFSHKLSAVEERWPVVELEAFAIVKSVEKFKHYLMGRSFNLITDQRGVSFLLHGKHASCVKNSNINRWRLELAEYNYHITYRPGKLNVVADALSRISSLTSNTVEQDTKDMALKLHQEMGHPGAHRLSKFLAPRVNSQENLQKISERVISECEICAQLKPRFVRVPTIPLIQSAKSWSRFSIDFVGPKAVSHRGCR